MVLKVTLLAVGQASSVDFSRELADSKLQTSKNALGLHIIRFDMQAPALIPLTEWDQGGQMPIRQKCCAIVQQVLQV
jgi:hypothetical protein